MSDTDGQGGHGREWCLLVNELLRVEADGLKRRGSLQAALSQARKERKRKKVLEGRGRTEVLLSLSDQHLNDFEDELGFLEHAEVGWTCDFAHRITRTALKLGKISKREFRGYLANILNEDMVREEMKNERLYDRLMACLSKFHRSRDHADWTSDTKKLLQATCQLLAQQKIESSALRAEVNATMAENSGLPKAEVQRTKRGETTQSRQDRLEVFWEVYREVAEKGREPKDRHLAGRIKSQADELNKSLDARPGREQSERIKDAAVSEDLGLVAASAPASITLPKLHLKAVRPVEDRSGLNFSGKYAAALGMKGGGFRRRALNFGIPLSYHSKGSISSTRSIGQGCKLPRIVRVAKEETAGNTLHQPRQSPASPRENRQSPRRAPTQKIGTKDDMLIEQVVQGAGDFERAFKLACKSYVQNCADAGIRPLTLPFTTGHSDKLLVNRIAISDEDMPPLACMVQQVPFATEVDLAGNGLLADRSLALLVKALLGRPVACHLVPSLTRLDLSGCTRLGKATFSALMSALSGRAGKGLSLLRTLSLNGVLIPLQCCLPFAEILGQHLRLQNLQLASGGFGHAASASITELLKSSSLEVLNLSWNVLGIDDFLCLGNGSNESQSLHTLDISGCSARSVTNRDQPIEYFLERLIDNETLKSLDISLNHIDYRGTLIIEDVLQHHCRLSYVDISDNPLGAHGSRSLVRLMAENGSGLKRLRIENCLANRQVAQDQDQLQIFNPIQPGGRYNLELDRPYHRSLLRMLHKECDHFKMAPADALIDVTFSEGKYNQLQKKQGVWDVPQKGRLSTTLALDWAGLDGISEAGQWDFGKFLLQHMSSRRMRLGTAKVAHIFCFWRRASEDERLMLLDAFAADFLLTYPQISELCTSQCKDSMRTEVICRLLHCVEHGVPMQYLSMLLNTSMAYFTTAKQKLRKLASFNAENPTWHYVLDLQNPADFAMAEKLMLLNRWEARIETSLQRIDTSEFGNRSRMRNILHRGRALPFRDIFRWVMPKEDVLECDYVSGKRPGNLDYPMDAEYFGRVLQYFEKSSLRDELKVNVLRQISNWLTVLCSQVRELLGVFRSHFHRSKGLMVCFFRIGDMHNEKIIRSRFADAQEQEQLRESFGFATFFPFIQPEAGSFTFSLEKNDQRHAAHILIQIMLREGSDNMRDVSLVLSNGVHDPLPMGLPRSWEFLDNLPKSGVLSSRYVCPPEERKFMVRRTLMQKYGYWQLEVQESDVQWWTGLIEAPTDVNTLVEFLISHFETVQDPFVIMDGRNGNGVINLKEFQDGLAKMGCTKFRGPDKEKRIEAIFRYLDPGGEGTISKNEWMVLQQLWREMVLTIQEFVSFLSRMFDFGPNLLQHAWDKLDADANGSISADEWDAVIKEQLNYFGASDILFNFLDRDDEGSVEFDEFMALERFESEAPEYVGKRKRAVAPVSLVSHGVNQSQRGRNKAHR